MNRDNHNGPMLAELKTAFPDATRFHWHVNAFNDADKYWMVGTPAACGGGAGITWQDVPVAALSTLGAQ